MTIGTKDEVAAVLGKYRFLAIVGKKLINKACYLGGNSSFDEMLSSKRSNEYMTVFEMRPRGLEVMTNTVFQRTRIGLHFEEIDYLVIESRQQIVQKREKSIIGRALLDGILFGPVGAVIGGMTGIGHREIKVSEVENILTVKVKDTNDFLTFSVANKDYKAVDKYLNSFFEGQYKYSEEIEIGQMNNETNTSSVTDE
jgi:hypothetical protein